MNALSLLEINVSAGEWTGSDGLPAVQNAIGGLAGVELINVVEVNLALANLLKEHPSRFEKNRPNQGSKR